MVAGGAGRADRAAPDLCQRDRAGDQKSDRDGARAVGARAGLLDRGAIFRLRLGVVLIGSNLCIAMNLVIEIDGLSAFDEYVIQ